MCHYCGHEYQDKVYRNTVCPSCGKDLKICLNCKFYDPGAHWDCRETIQEPVRDKESANFCDYFVYVAKPSSGRKAPGSSDASSEAKKLFDSLFQDE